MATVMKNRNGVYFNMGQKGDEPLIDLHRKNGEMPVNRHHTANR